MISAGNKIAKATGIRLITTKEGAVAFEVAFKFDENGVPQTLTWQGWLKNKSGGTDAMERTMSTLQDRLDYDFSQDTVKVPKGDPREGMLANQGAINRNKEVQIVVEYEEYEGKQRPRIRWINEVGGGQFAGISAEQSNNVFDAIGFKAMAEALKAKKNQAKAAPSLADVAANADVPF